jgi:sugar phosphate isomerase/epimerase
MISGLCLNDVLISLLFLGNRWKDDGMDGLGVVERILWWGNVRGLTFQQRLQFAVKNGFNALNVSPHDIENLKSRGETLKSISQMASDCDIQLTYLDPIVSWLPHWQPGPEASDFMPFLSAGLGQELDMASELGMDRVLTITAFPGKRYSAEQCAEHLATYATRAASYNISCVVEAMPMWGLQNFVDVVAVWRLVNMPNVRILFDTWHYCRGVRNDALISELPIGAIDHVQIADGPTNQMHQYSILDECLQHRRMIGEGELPIAELLILLRNAGHLKSVGPEVFSVELDTLEPDALASRLMPGFNAAINAAFTN